MQSASIIFLDSPVGTGFSYSTTQEGWASSDTKAANETYHFLMQVHIKKCDHDLLVRITINYDPTIYF